MSSVTEGVAHALESRVVSNTFAALSGSGIVSKDAALEEGRQAGCLAKNLERITTFAAAARGGGRSGGESGITEAPTKKINGSGHREQRKQIPGFSFRCRLRCLILSSGFLFPGLTVAVATCSSPFGVLERCVRGAKEFTADGTNVGRREQLAHLRFALRQLEIPWWRGDRPCCVCII